jgi:hypothetical protein
MNELKVVSTAIQQAQSGISVNQESAATLGGNTIASLLFNEFRDIDGQGVSLGVGGSGGTFCADIFANTFINVATVITGTTPMELQQTGAGVFNVQQQDLDELASVNELNPADINVSGTVNFGQTCLP